jgi:hypothetical protein
MICTTTIARTVAGFRVPLNFSVPTYIGTNMTEVFKLTMGDKSALQALVAQRKAEAPVPVRS